MVGKELAYIVKAHSNKHFSGDGLFTAMCHKWLEHNTNCTKALLSHSCTAALEIAAILLDIVPGDEIIMPSYTFVSTANAFVLRGGVPIFVDIREDTLNLNETFLEKAITPKTRAIVPVHYAGVSCEMDRIVEIAKKYSLMVIEDAAQAMMSYYKGRMLGSIGDFGTYSFHETKNVIAGEGGCLLINNSKFSQRSEIIREKGTNRSQFFRGEVDKYTWRDIGSSFLPGEIVAAFLFAQLEHAEELTKRRLSIWQNYKKLLKPLASQGLLKCPVIPENCQHNAHMYYIILPKKFDRLYFLNELKKHGIHAVSHYEPLHSSPAGKKYCRVSGDLSVTNKVSQQLIRLPMWIGLEEEQQKRIVETLEKIFKSYTKKYVQLDIC